MRRVLFISTFVFISIFLSFSVTGATSSIPDALMKEYHEQYEKNKAEIKERTDIINRYKECFERDGEITKREFEIYASYKYGSVRRSDTLEERMALAKEKLAVWQKVVEIYNVSTGESRGDISEVEAKRDQDQSRKRVKELMERNRDLKIKLLEKNGNLPSWWVD